MFFARVSPTASFLLIGCSPSWYLSGRIEFTLLISRNFKFRVGLLKLKSLGSRAPFREFLDVLEMSSVGVEMGLVRDLEGCRS